MHSKKRALLLIVASAFLLAAVFGDGSIDLAFSDGFYDTLSRSFPFGERAFVERILYKGHKIIMFVVAVGFIVWGYRAAKSQHERFTWGHFWVGVIGTVSIIGVVTILKKVTGVECPWSLDRYGGTEPFLPLDQVVRNALEGNIGRGRCFPAGHSTGGLYLVAWAVALSSYSRRAAFGIAFMAVFLGLLMGLLRIAQGAHFLSHVFWALWCSAVIGYGLWLGLEAWERRSEKSTAITV